MDSADEWYMAKIDLTDAYRMVPFQDPPIKNLMISPVCVIPKANSTKSRMIFNLSEPKGYSVNDNIPDTNTSVTYCTVRQVARYVMDSSDEWYMAKIDLTDAYRMVPIKKTNGST